MNISMVGDFSFVGWWFIFSALVFSISFIDLYRKYLNELTRRNSMKEAETPEDQEVMDMSKVRNVLNHGFVRLVDHMGGDDAVVQSARVSYGKGTKTVNEDRGLIRYLMRHLHTTPFEQVNFRFHCKMPIFVARQWIRHRMGSFNEYSGRYSEMREEFFLPEKDTITKQNPSNKQGGATQLVADPEGAMSYLANSQKMSFTEYQTHLDQGMRKELARVNLPLSIYTEWYWKVDLHNLFHFLNLRLDDHAQYEIRVYGDAIYDLIKPIVPLCCEAFEDYRRQSRSLSRMEQRLLSDMLTSLIPEFGVPSKELYPKYGEKYGMSKRETEDFFGWYQGLLEMGRKGEKDGD